LVAHSPDIDRTWEVYEFDPEARLNHSEFLGRVIPAVRLRQEVRQEATGNRASFHNEFPGAAILLISSRLTPALFDPT
jgi:hypothetical protein